MAEVAIESASVVRVAEVGSALEDMNERPPLLRVCELLNQAGAAYLVCGGHACILHGLVRTTEDVDILIDGAEENCRRVIEGLSGMADGAARELTPADLLENVVVKVADEVEVDISRLAWRVSYREALPEAMEVVMDGVRVPFLGLEALIASKETYREQDRIDLARLMALKRARGG